MFYDYHTHSSFSDDSPTPLSDMLDEAVRIGLAEIAVTDHFDPGYPDPDFPFEPDFESYHAALEEFQVTYRNKIKIIKGIEIGIMHDQLSRCRSAATSYDYDYIIASFHCAEGEPLYNGHYFDNKTASQAYADYFTYVFNNIKEFKDYSNLGHLNLVARYCTEPAPAFSSYSDICEEIFKMIIPEGKGIELNTSSFRYKLECTCPSEEILKLYKSLGGEIISIGSDAHTPDAIADHFEFATEYLKNLGFKYITTFEQMKPSFVKL